MSALVVAGCGGITGRPAPQAGQQPAAAPTGATAPAPGGGQGVVAKPLSAAKPVEARDVRLVRTGAAEIALQFEYFNGGTAALSPSSAGIDGRELAMALYDLPKGTAYGVLPGTGNDGRVSASVDDDVEPGRSTTVTIVFSAPPEDTQQMMVVLNGLLPVSVPVQAAGAPVLRDDPVLQAASAPGDTKVGPLLCETDGATTTQAAAPTQYQIGSDALFAFGSADLTPAAERAITSLAEQVKATEGAVTIDGHTDSIGGDAANQTLSDQRAASVLAALKAKLGAGFTYTPKGHGETQPVASNTNPDGSDNPEGRAQNRRVVVMVTGAAAGERVVERDLGSEASTRGLRATVGSVQRYAGFLLTEVKVSNPTSEDLELALEVQPDTTGAITEGLLSVVDTKNQRRGGLCSFIEPRYWQYAGNPGTAFGPSSKQGTVPAGAEVTVWGIIPAPPADVTSVDVEVGGFVKAIPAEVTPGR
ncbi:OmpA family protein [Pseudonocardia sp. TRM90224]|uniref:OmpA family protein n=1 Tax=Pseudonocardia sp. TRM90224 TaxID=2812678 RepID=UPI001E48857E|nr:OmpA family protein [Pseudonocardia sp. TRM90224]